MNINFSDQLCVQPVSVFILFIPRIKSAFDMRVIDITLTQIENDMPGFFYLYEKTNQTSHSVSRMFQPGAMQYAPCAM